MSASREKKQRQNAGPDQKAVKIQQEQAARKRKTILYSVIAGVVVVAVAALLIWNSGFFQARSTAATLGGEKLSLAELSYYYYDARSYYAMYGSYLGFDTTKTDEAQIQDQNSGRTYREFFLESALDAAREDLVLSNEAKSTGHTESEVKETLDQNIANIKSTASSNHYSYASYLRALYGPYMTPGIYESLYTRTLMANLARSDKGVELYNGYSQEELEEYYEEHADTLDTIEYSHLYFKAAEVETKDAEGNELSEDDVAKLEAQALADAKAKAEEALEALEGGASFKSQIDKYELTTGGDHVTVVGTSSIDESYRDELCKLDKDTPTLVESDKGCYVVTFHNRYLDDTPTRDVRHILIRAEATQEEKDGSTVVVAPTDEAWAAAEEKANTVQAEWEAGGKTREDFIALVEKYTDDTSSIPNGGLYERAYEGYFVEEFGDWVFNGGHQAGDVGLVKHDPGRENTANQYWGYHLIYMEEENEPVWMGSVRNTLASDARTEWIESLTADCAASLTSGADALGR